MLVSLVNVSYRNLKKTVENQVLEGSDKQCYGIDTFVIQNSTCLWLLRFPCAKTKTQN